MTKGASIKFTTYEDSVPQILNNLQVQNAIQKFEKIVLKPSILDEKNYTNPQFVEAVLRYCIENKNPNTEVFIAEGADGFSTEELFDSTGYQKLAEKYSIGIIDLNETEVDEIESPDFLKYEVIKYPRILSDSCVISLPPLIENEETDITTSLSNMLGAYPASHYSGFFSLKKNKIRKVPIKYSIHDIIVCNIPNFAVIDASKHGYILAGLPIEIDKQASKLLGIDWKTIPHIKLISDSFTPLTDKKKDPELVAPLQ